MAFRIYDKLFCRETHDDKILYLPPVWGIYRFLILYSSRRLSSHSQYFFTIKNRIGSFFWLTHNSLPFHISTST